MLLKPLLKYLAGDPRAHQNTGDAQERHLQHASIYAELKGYFRKMNLYVLMLVVPAHCMCPDMTQGDCESTLLQLP